LDTVTLTLRWKFSGTIYSNRTDPLIWAGRGLAAIIVAMKIPFNPDRLRTWIEESLAYREHILATSNQGTILLYEQSGFRLVIKTVMGRGLFLMVRQRTLLREYRAYQRLRGARGVPECFGMVDGRHLVLEYIPGSGYRDATLADRNQFFDSLLEILRSIHARGVSHGDLKSKSNLLVTPRGEPCIVDFGTAFVHKAGFHPVNNWLFRFGKRLDFNAWVKHKYHGLYRNASDVDRALLNYGWIETLVRRLSGRSMDRVVRRKGDTDSE